MRQFTFKAQNTEDSARTGTLMARDRDSAIRTLSEQGFTVTELDYASRPTLGFRRLLGLGLKSVKGEELLTFTQELGAMLNAGITLRNAMDVLVEDMESPTLTQVLTDVDAGIAAGSNLSDLLKNYPTVFSKFYTSMIAAGESSGTLPQTLLKLATYIEKSENLKKKVQAALYYPAMVISFALVIITAILVFGIPRFAEFYSGVGMELPWATRMFIKLGEFASNSWYLALPLAAMAAYGVSQALRTPWGQLHFDMLKLNSPVFGRLLQRLSIARFARTLSTLYASGVPILKAMEIVSGTTGNRVMENVVTGVVRNLKEGETITAPLRRSKIFTPMAVSMIAAGEESGSLHNMLGKLADFYEVQVELTLQALSGLLEPIVLVVIGILIGTVIVVLGLPLLQIGTIIH